MSAPPQPSQIRVGSVILARYRVDLLLSRGASPTLMCTRYPDGEKVLVRVLFDPLTQAKGPLLVHLVKEAHVALAGRADIARILKFGIDRATGARCLVMTYDQSATAAQIVDPEGRENRTAHAFLEIAGALVERHEHDRRQATPEAARGRPNAVAPRPREHTTGPTRSRSTPDEHVVWAQAKVVDGDDTVRGIPRRQLHAIVAFLVVSLVIGAAVFSQDRKIELPPQLYPWYHDYGGGTTGYTDLFDGPADPNDPFANDPDVRAARAMRITVRSNPSGANLWDGMRNLGRTPTEIQRPSRGSEMVLRVSKAGYGETTLAVSWNSPRSLKVTLGGGNIGDETSKFIQELKRQNATGMEEIEKAVGEKAPTELGKPDGLPEVESLPKGLPKVEGAVPEIYEDE
ncbi:MAG: PEGA domain-containing protein [Deltaproteobacteria bacterium]